MLRRVLATLLASVLLLGSLHGPGAEVSAKPISTQSGRSVGGSFSDVLLPGGSATFTAQNWLQTTGASGYIVYCATSSQLYADSALYPYQYVVTSGATLSKVIGSVAAGTYYVRIAAYAGSIVYDLGPEIAYAAS